MNFLKHSFTSFVYHRIQLTLICSQCRRYFTERTMRLLTIFDVGSDVLCLHLLVFSQTTSQTNLKLLRIVG